MYFEGEFDLNKPKGKGKWVFKDGNVLSGSYAHKPKEEGEDGDAEPEVEGEEGGAKKPKFSIVWTSAINITEAAHKVNCSE